MPSAHHPARPPPRDTHAIPVRNRAGRCHPDYFRDQVDLGRGPHRASRTRPAVCGGQRFHGQARQMPDAALARWADRAGRVRASRMRPANPATCSGPARCRGCCRRASIALPMRRMMRAWRRWRSRSGTYRFGRYRKNETPGGAAGAARRCRCRRYHANGGGGSAGARPDQHALERYGSGGTGAGRAGAGCAFRRQLQLHRRRRTREPEFSADPRRRHGLDARAAPDRPELGRSLPPEGDAGRQGRVLRYRRPRPEAVERHADHEKGHGRRRQRAGAGADGDGCRG